MLFAKSKSETPDTNISETIVYPTETLTDFFTSANSFFNKFIIDGKVNYTAIKNDPDSLQKLINFIGKADLTGADKNTATAFQNILPRKLCCRRFSHTHASFWNLT